MSKKATGLTLYGDRSAAICIVASLLACGAGCKPSSVEVAQKDATQYSDIWFGDVGSDGAVADHFAEDQPAADQFAAADANQSGDSGWPQGTDLDLSINFQPPGTPPSGFSADTGEVFEQQRGYGWNIDLSQNTQRADLLSDKRLDTYISAGAQGRVDTWELELPAALYLVTLVSGNPEMAAGPMAVRIEGVPLFDRDSVQRNEYLWAVDRLVGVADGRLTMQVGTSAGTTQINFIRVRAADPAGSCAPRTEVCNGEDDDCDSGVDEEAICLNAPTVCYSSTLENGSNVAQNGFMMRGGTFVDGGLKIDAPGTRLERTLSGNFYQGTLRFEAKDLWWQKPMLGTSGCMRTVFDINHATGHTPARSRLYLASTAPGCAGMGPSVLRLAMHSAFCCVDSPELPSSNDGDWHSFVVKWDAATVELWVDQTQVVAAEYFGPSIGRDPVLWFGSSGNTSDYSEATFRNLEICNEVQ